jgi:hypothetical protein
VLRVVDPFRTACDAGDGASLEQLWLETRRGAAASAGVTRVHVAIVRSTPLPTAKLGARVAAAAMIALALAALVALVAGR